MTPLTIADAQLLALRPGRTPVVIAAAGWAERERAARLVYRRDMAAAVAGGEIERGEAIRLGRRYGLLKGAA